MTSRADARPASAPGAPPPFELDLSQPEPIPESAISRAVELMREGRLFRYGETAEGDVNDAAELESRFAALTGRRYAVAVNSCGASLFVALKAAGVLPGDRVLVNGFTLAPVPGAVAHAGAVPVLVEITDELTIDMDDLRRKAASSGARVLLISHMRGHLCDLDRLSALCADIGLLVIEDCAHALGATWDGRPAGSFGTAACFSTQTFKHLNSGEGGFLVTDDNQLAARAILYTGSYMLYGQHSSRPPLDVFEPLRGVIPNFSLRMTALAAALIGPQLELLPQRIARMNASYAELERELRGIPQIAIIERPPQEDFVGSSLQFRVVGCTSEQIAAFVRVASQLGIHVKWFGEPLMQGFTSRPSQWEYLPSAGALTRTESILATLCDLRIPPAMSPAQAAHAADILRYAAAQALT